MTPEEPKLTIHMVSSLDGFIAKKDGDVSWMHSTDNYEKGITLTDEYIPNFLESIDCYVMGSATYEKALQLGWPYGDKPVFVLTRRDLKSEKETVKFYSGDILQLVKNRLKSDYKNIWMVGGSALTREFLKQELVDEIVITFLPIILGDGILFFDYVRIEQKLHLKDVIPFKDGMVELCYEVTKS